MNPVVAVIMGSKSDEDVTKGAVEILKEFGVEYEVRVLSAHRNPEALSRYVKECGASVFIGVAGMSAHLPGFIAAHTLRPVIGVPVSGKLGGLDSLLSISQMPTGVPVATVAVDGARNAALLAIEILSTKDRALEKKLLEYRRRRSFG